jgi:hypothetical protein
MPAALTRILPAPALAAAELEAHVGVTATRRRDDHCQNWMLCSDVADVDPCILERDVPSVIVACNLDDRVPTGPGEPEPASAH